jgi:hypothetical protein
MATTDPSAITSHMKGWAIFSLVSAVIDGKQIDFGDARGQQSP